MTNPRASRTSQWCDGRHVSDTLEPRVVDRPYVGRWLRASLQLFIRSPARFVATIALLGIVDNAAVSMARGLDIPEVWVNRTGLLTLPCLWVLVCALARGADDAALGRQALAELRRWRVWSGTLAIGIRIVILFIIVYWVLGAPYAPPRSGLRNPGDFIASVLTGAAFYSMTPGFCFFPLLLLVPTIERARAESLARRAQSLNGLLVFGMLAAVLVLGTYSLASVFPLGGLVNATGLVYIGIVNYVAYRDIFERRAENAAVPVVREDLAIPARVLPAPEVGG